MANTNVALGPIQEIPYLIKQDRWTFFRVGLIDPLSVDSYTDHNGFKGLQKAFDIGSEAVVDAVDESGLRGRGGAGFPTGIKWRTVADTDADQKYITCNADEGDSGTFSDRMLMEGDPMCLIEGMIIAGFAVGASKGYIYLRAEYPLTHKILLKAIEAARDAGWLGKNIKDSGFDFDIDVHLGAGSYVCGEETAMLESLEGKKGIVRYRPPLPAIEGLFGKPTVVNNVITLASVPNIIKLGGERYAGFGQNRSKGTLAFQLAGNIQRGGLVEKAFGVTLRELIEEYGGGTLLAGPSKPSRSAARWAPTFPPRIWTRRSTTKPLSTSAQFWVTAASSYLTTSPTWRNKRVLRWNFALSSPAANVRPAGSARRAVSR